MKLIKVTKGGALHFELSDGRLGVTYPTGYVRVSCKHTHSRLYQINKKIGYVPDNSKYTFWRRELIPLQRDRINHLFRFNNMNCR
jgi:hypothetical protein